MLSGRIVIVKRTFDIIKIISTVIALVGNYTIFDTVQNYYGLISVDLNVSIDVLFWSSFLIHNLIAVLLIKDFIVHTRDERVLDNEK